MRTVRGVMAGSVATFVALMSHVLGGGTVPEWPGIAVPWALSLVVCGAVLNGRRLSVWRLSASVVLSQVLFHGMFVLGAASTAAAHGVTGVTPGHGEPGPAPGIGVPGTFHVDLAMAVWHAMAASVTIAVLHRAERVLVRLRELAGDAVVWVRGRFGVVPAAILPAPAAPALLPVRADRRRHHDPHLSVRRRRGPPVRGREPSVWSGNHLPDHTENPRPST